MSQKIGLIGLAAMGINLSKNIASKGIPISVFNRTAEKTHDLESSKIENINTYFDLNEFVDSLESPKKIILLVKAGESTDDQINQLKPLLAPGDIIIEMGNSYWKDTLRRQKELLESGISLVGTGVSGGWKGALSGPSIMPSGDKTAVDQLMPIFNQIAASDYSGNPATTNVGLAASGHFVKMIHNGIEYSIMQSIVEFYDFMKHLGLSNNEIALMFDKINTGVNKSYLLDITVEIMKYKLPNDSSELVDYIKPVAMAKGTGLWSVEAGLEFNCPCSLLFAGLEGRIISQLKNANSNFTAIGKLQYKEKETVEILAQAFQAVCYLSFVQGLELIKNVSAKYNWNVDLNQVLRIWQGGCIIRTKILEKLATKDGNFIDTTILIEFDSGLQALFKLINDYNIIIATPALSAAKNYLAGLFGQPGGYNLLQAQRDYFGSHSFQRIDKDGVFTDHWGQV